MKNKNKRKKKRKDKRKGLSALPKKRKKEKKGKGKGKNKKNKQLKDNYISGQSEASLKSISGGISHLNNEHINVHDNNTVNFEHAKTCWLFGKWEKLASVDSEKLSHHPNRREFALLVATAHQQLGQYDKAYEYIKAAMKWGCNKRLAAQFLIAGVYNTLGCIYALKHDKNRTTEYFQESIRIGVRREEMDMMGHARALQEISKRGLLPQVEKILGDTL